MPAADRVKAVPLLTVMLLVLGLLAVASPRSISNIHYQTNGVSYTLDVPDGAEYVALGDSYASSGSKSRRLPFDGCARNPDDLGYVVAEQLQPATFTDRSCAGAKIASISRVDPERPEVSPQIDAVGPATRLVTMSLGANSMEFGPLIVNCFIKPNTGLCQFVSTINLPGSDSYEAIREQYREAVELVAARAADDADVVLVGYLPLHAESGPIDSSCLAATGDSIENIAAWRIYHRALNQLVSDVAADTGAIYVAAPGDHPLCAPDPYVAGEHANDPANGIDAYGLHPTVVGQRELGRLVAERIRGLRDPASRHTP